MPDSLDDTHQGATKLFIVIEAERAVIRHEPSLHIEDAHFLNRR